MLLPLALVLACAHRPWDDPGEGWVQVRSEHLLVHTDADPDTFTPVIDRLEDVHQALAESFFPGGTAARAEVLLFDRARAFKAVSPNGDFAGFYAPRLGTQGEGLLVFSMDGDFDWQIAPLAAHELTHKFMDALGRRVPIWFGEGFAEYVEGIRFESSFDMVIFDAAALGPQMAYFSDVVPLSNLLKADGSAFYGTEMTGHYMTGWMVVRELLSQPGQGAVVRFQRLVERLSRDASPAAQEAALVEAFGAPLGAIETRLREVHSSVRSGVGQQTSRRTFGRRFLRAPRKPAAIQPADPAVIKALCRSLHERKNG